MIRCLVASAAPAAKLPRELNGVGFDQRLNEPLPLDAVFRDESGQTVRLGQYFHGKPVILATVYYRCPMLCSQILSGVVRGLRPLSLQPGRDFEIVAVSINPDETPQDATAKRDQYSHSYSRTAGPAGWHFLVGSEASIHAVTDAIGFHYRYDPPTKMYFHASGITVLTPEGLVSRYLYGVDYEPKDLKLSLIDAGHQRIGSPVDQVLLFCYHYDPKTGKYGAVVVNMLKLASALLLVCLAVVLTWLWRHDLRQYGSTMKEVPRT
jgi:protein SCO1